MEVTDSDSEGPSNSNSNNDTDIVTVTDAAIIGINKNKLLVKKTYVGKPVLVFAFGFLDQSIMYFMQWLCNFYLCGVVCIGLQ